MFGDVPKFEYLCRRIPEIMTNMTQLTVSIEDVSKLDQIKQAISLLRGVTNVTLKRQTKTGMDRAIDDIKHGRVYEASSVEDLIKQCKA